MKTVISTFAMAALVALGLAAHPSHAASSLCGNGDYDPLVGSYIGGHPDLQALNPPIDNTGVIRFNVGGTASSFDQTSLGVDSAWTSTPLITGVGLVGETFQWTKTGNHKYSFVQVAMFVSPSPTNGFPMQGPVLIKGIGTISLSADCSTLVFSGDAYRYDINEQALIAADHPTKTSSRYLASYVLNMYKLR